MGMAGVEFFGELLDESSRGVLGKIEVGMVDRIMEVAGENKQNLSESDSFSSADLNSNSKESLPLSAETLLEKSNKSYDKLTNANPTSGWCHSTRLSRMAECENEKIYIPSLSASVMQAKLPEGQSTILIQGVNRTGQKKKVPSVPLRHGTANLVPLCMVERCQLGPKVDWAAVRKRREEKQRAAKE